MANELAIRMFQLASSKLVTKSLWAAAKLGIADLLAAGPRTVEELAAATKTDPSSLYRVLRVLAPVGVFTEVSEHRFENAPLAAFLRDEPTSMRNMVLWLNDPRHDHMFEAFLHSVQTGETVAQKTHGKPVWEVLADMPDLGAIFHAAMANNSNNMHAAAVATYDFGGVHTLVDVGGGHGALLTRILVANPALKGIVFDRPEVIGGAKSALDAAKLTGRCDAVGGDFFQGVPGGDAHLLSFILHDWKDAEATALLSSVHRAQKPGGKLIIVEQVIPTGNEPSFGKVIDIEMLAMAGGRERTEKEFRALFAAAGYELTRVVATPSPCSILEGRRIG